MRVALLSGEFPPLVGGVADYTALLATALHRQGLALSIITSQAAQSESAAHPFTVHPSVAHWGFASWPRLAALLRSEQAQVVHLQYQTAAYGMRPAVHFLPSWLRRRGYRVVTTFHDLRPPYLFPKAGPLRGWVVRLLARTSNAVVAITEEDAQTLRGLLAGGKTALCVIPIGSNIPAPVEQPSPEKRASLRAALGITPPTSGDEAPPLLVAYFGLLNQSKGLDTLLHALLTLRSWGISFRLLVIGGDVGASDATNRATQRWFQEELRTLGLQDAVQVTGHLPPEEVSRHLLAADVCALPYREGASLRRGSLMAALAHGCAIVTTGLPLPSATPPLLPRLVDGEHALLVPPEAPEALAEALRRLAQTPHLRQQLSQGARALAQHFTWEHIAIETIALYSDLLPMAIPGTA